MLEESYKPHPLLRNAHINTLYPALFRNPNFEYTERVRMNTEDNDFIDIDLKVKGSKKAVILLHGFEGSSRSQYILGVADHLYSKGFDIIAPNHRSCSGEVNRKASFYHSGFTQDLELVLHHYSPRYEEIYIVGYSLGGNITLKYLGDGIYTPPKNLKAAVAISVPMDLASSAKKLCSRENSLYAFNFLRSLRKKLEIKAAHHPNTIKLELWPKVKNLRDFDDYYTAPLHGLVDSNDYYRYASSKPFLKSILVNTMVLGSIDDPFLTPACFPSSMEFENNPRVTLNYSRHGGHVGYARFISGPSWADIQVGAFFDQFDR